jgi:adenosine deaminase
MRPDGPGGFAAALQSGNALRLVSFPKADLHCHSIFGASLKSIKEWAGKPLNSAPARMGSFDEMREYAHRELYPCIHNRRGFEFTAERTLIEAIQDGVTILEMSLDVTFLQYYGDHIVGFFDFVQRLTAKYSSSITFGPEIGISRNRLPSTQIPLAVECIDSALFRSIDLYGNELAQPPEAYRSLYTHASNRGLTTKAHVGEFGDASLMEKTIDVLDLREIQHGVAAATSHTLMRRLREERIRLNVCPSSNIALSVAEEMAHHPIRALVEHGVRVSINSDDKTIFGQSVSDEYMALYSSGAVNADDLERIRKDSLEP